MTLLRLSVAEVENESDGEIEFENCVENTLLVVSRLLAHELGVVARASGCSTSSTDTLFSNMSVAPTDS